MTHNIQIGVNIDEESIKQAVVQETARNIQRGLFGTILSDNKVVQPRFTDEFKRDFLTRYFDKELKSGELMAPIEKLAAEKLAEMMVDRLMKSKAFKDSVATKIAERTEENSDDTD